MDNIENPRWYKDPVSRTTTALPPLSRPATAIFGGLAVATVATLLPWEQNTGYLGEEVAATPADTGSLPMILVALGATAFAAWPLVRNELSTGRRALMAVMTAVVSFFAWAKFAGLSAAQSQLDSDSGTNLLGTESVAEYGAGFGLLLYCAAVVAVWVGVVLVWVQAHRSPAPSAPGAGFPPPTLAR